MVVDAFVGIFGYTSESTLADKFMGVKFCFLNSSVSLNNLHAADRCLIPKLFESFNVEQMVPPGRPKSSCACDQTQERLYISGQNLGCAANNEPNPAHVMQCNSCRAHVVVVGRPRWMSYPIPASP